MVRTCSLQPQEAQEVTCLLIKFRVLRWELALMKPFFHRASQTGLNKVYKKKSKKRPCDQMWPSKQDTAEEGGRGAGTDPQASSSWVDSTCSCSRSLTQITSLQMPLCLRALLTAAHSQHPVSFLWAHQHFSSKEKSRAGGFAGQPHLLIFASPGHRRREDVQHSLCCGLSVR